MHDLSQHNAPLILKRGKSLDVLRALLKQSGAKSVAWARRYEPDLAARDDKIADILQKEGIEVSIQSGFLLFEPEEIKTQSSTPFKVFTPFSKACFAAPSPAVPLSAPIKIQGLSGIESDKLESWKLIPKAARWPKGLEDAWSASEQGASQNLHNFIKERLQFYKTTRDRPDILGTCYHGSSSSVTSIFLKLRTLLTRTSLERILMASSPLHTRLHNRALTKIFQKFPLAR
jgi:deoxyribodipyrimidine photo-lyase